MKAKRQQAHSVFQVVKQTSDIIWIVDCYEDNSEALMKTVTNDADAVCASIFANHGNKRIIYRDTAGNWDELVHDRGVFKDFKSARGMGVEL